MSKKIGIIQVDGKYPNLALMKIAAYHEQQGDSVAWFDSSLFAPKYDLVYASKLFSFSEWPRSMPIETIKGGTGIDHYNRLPAEMEACNPSYSLYPTCNYHLGFSMKGCRFNCSFCVVPKKEGRPYNYNTIDEILINPNGGNRLMLLDNDFFGGTNWEGNLHRIIELNLKVCFVQGLNIRIITPEQATLLAKTHYMNSKFKKRYLTFAWDRFNDGKLIRKGIAICNDAGIPCQHMQFFILIGFDTTEEQDLERVMTLKDLGCLPFVMPYNKSDPYQKSFTRYVNNRWVFNSCSWHSYKYKQQDHAG